jgi:hypothetical protein
MGRAARRGVPDAARSEAGRAARPSLRQGPRARPPRGRLAKAWAQELGLAEGIVVAMAASTPTTARSVRVSRPARS